MVQHFFRTLTTNPVFEDAAERRLLDIPLAEDWDARPFLTHIVSVRTPQPRHELYLSLHLLLTNMNAYAVSYPVVPKGQSRVRLVFHAHNTTEQIDALVTGICEWAQEMMQMEDCDGGLTVPSAARKAFALQSGA